MGWLRNWLRRETDPPKRQTQVQFESMREWVSYYQQFGFFAGRTPESATESLIGEYETGHGRKPTLNDPWEDLYLLANDASRVWYGDPEADVGDGSNVYVGVLSEWASISSGVFAPQDVRETWQGDDGPITVTFLLADGPHTVHPSFHNDWIDLNILDEINRLIKETRFEFAYAIDGNSAWVMCVRFAERKQLVGDRALPFHQENLAAGLGAE